MGDFIYICHLIQKQLEVREPVLLIEATSTRVGAWLKTFGVKLFRGTVGGGVEPVGFTVTSGLIKLIIVPGVDAGIVELLEGINNVGNDKSVGSWLTSIILPTPVTASDRFKFVEKRQNRW